MRRLLTWAVITLGIAAVVRKLRARGEVYEQPATAPASDPAEELRQKLAETREDETPVPGAPPASEPTVDEQRAEVHDQGRAAIDEMQRSNED
jgi:hypothetical protein